MTLFGYMRETKAGRPLAAQNEALRDGGITDWSAAGKVYSDPLPKKRAKPDVPLQPAFDDMVKALRPGAVVILAGLDVLASTREGLRDRLAQIGAMGASVRLMDTGETLTCTPEAVAMAAAIERATAELHRQRANAARGSAAWAQSARGGPRFKWTEAQYAAAKPIYLDVTLTAKEIKAKSKIPYRTLHRYFSGKGIHRNAGPGSRKDKA